MTFLIATTAASSLNTKGQDDVCAMNQVHERIIVQELLLDRTATMLGNRNTETNIGLAWKSSSVWERKERPIHRSGGKTTTRGTRSTPQARIFLVLGQHTTHHVDRSVVGTCSPMQHLFSCAKGNDICQTPLVQFGPEAPNISRLLSVNIGGKRVGRRSSWGCAQLLTATRDIC